MPEQALQVAFEIKTACDEISRRLLRWHWERKPGAHSLDALLEHIAARKQESPDYYDRMPDLTGKTSWQQLDTTLCMRVLLDPETDAARPLDLLGNTAHPSAARHACNAIRTARNEAAHAAVAADGAQAALLFNEAIEALEEGYAGTAFKENELAQYYREAEDYLSRCSEGKPLEARQSSPQNAQQAASPAIPSKPAAPKVPPGGRIPLPAAAAPVQNRAAARHPAAKSSRPAVRAGWRWALFWRRWCWDLSHALSAWDLCNCNVLRFWR